jgi:hypothetical protein
LEVAVFVVAVCRDKEDRIKINSAKED